MGEQEEVAGNRGARTSPAPGASLPGIPMDGSPLTVSPMGTPPTGTRRPPLGLPVGAPPPERLPDGAAAESSPALPAHPPVTAPAPVAFVKSLRDAITVVAIAGGAALAALLFAPGARNEVFKLFAVVYFSILPAGLYLRFMAFRGPTLWEEFTENLYRLRFDDPASLPRPTPHGRYYPTWAAARAGRAAPLTKTLYQKKFEGVFGSITGDDQSSPPRHTEKFGAVIVATILFSVAWVIVVMPAPLFHLTLLGQDPHGTESPYFPIDALRFGFLGAYFYAVQMLVRRYFQNDLKTSAYHNATMRIVTVALLTWTVDLGMRGQPDTYRWSLAFVIGVFPDVGWKALQTLVKLPLRGLVPSLRQLYPLSDLDGLNVWYEARLLEEGIEDMQNLATCNLVDVMLNTRIPVERLVDWIDQSILFLHLGKPVEGDRNPRDQLRRFGIRTATDLEDAFRPAHNVGDEAERIAKLERLLTTSPDEPSILRTILATLGSEPNLPYIRAWRAAEGGLRDAGAAGAS